MTLYIAKHRDGYCLTHDAQERPGGFVKTLCDHTITMPTALDPCDEGRMAELIEGSEMCMDCVNSIGIAPDPLAAPLWLNFPERQAMDGETP